jgi:hypothetical protein
MDLVGRLLVLIRIGSCHTAWVEFYHGMIHYVSIELVEFWNGCHR